MVQVFNGQINRIYDQLEEILRRNDATLAHVVNEMIFVTDIAKLIEGNAARMARYAAYAPPASTAVQVSGLFLPEAMIEVQATVDLALT